MPAPSGKGSYPLRPPFWTVASYPAQAEAHTCASGQIILLVQHLEMSRGWDEAVRTLCVSMCVWVCMVWRPEVNSGVQSQLLLNLLKSANLGSWVGNFLFVCCVWNKISLCSSGWSETRSCSPGWPWSHSNFPIGFPQGRYYRQEPPHCGSIKFLNVDKAFSRIYLRLTFPFKVLCSSPILPTDGLGKYTLNVYKSHVTITIKFWGCMCTPSLLTQVYPGVHLFLHQAWSWFSKQITVFPVRIMCFSFNSICAFCFSL